MEREQRNVFGRNVRWSAPDRCLDLEMSQFWQKKQPMLQPAVPSEKTLVPGRKWFSGFFSMGSICSAAGEP